MKAVKPAFLFTGLFILILTIAAFMGSAFTIRLTVEACAYALIALGLNVQWGYGKLFNFGILGFVMIGGMGAMLFSYPVNPSFWQSDGPILLLRVLAAVVIAGGLIVLTHKQLAPRLRGKQKGAAIIGAWLIGYILYRSQLDPAADYIETEAGFVGGLGMPVLLGWLAGGLLGGSIGYLMGKICLGLRTDYLAIATIGIAEIIRALTKNADWLTRGSLTVSPIPWPVPTPQEFTAMGVENNTLSFILARSAFLFVVLAILVLCYILLNRAYYGPWGRMMRAIRDNEFAAAAMGKNVKLRQIELFVLGSILMSAGGAILVSFAQIFDPHTFRPVYHTFFLWVMIIIGGTGNNLGAILGALLVYIVWTISAPVALVVFDGLAWLGGLVSWEPPKDWDARALQMRIFFLGLVIVAATRYSPKGLIPEKIITK